MTSSVAPGVRSRFLVPSLSQELSSDSSASTSSSDEEESSDEASSQAVTTVSDKSLSTAPSDPSQLSETTTSSIGEVECKAETFQANKTISKPPIQNKTNLQRVARQNNFDIIRMDLSPDQGESTESSPSLARQSYANISKPVIIGQSSPTYASVNLSPTRVGIVDQPLYGNEESKSGRNSRYHSTVSSPNNRKSRSRERPLDGRATIQAQTRVASDQIRERERELERIHRRSRELLMHPRHHHELGDVSKKLRDGDISPDRLSSLSASSRTVIRNQQDIAMQRNCISPSGLMASGVSIDGWRPVSSSASGMNFPSTRDIPPPLPPRIHSPQPTNGNNGSGSHSKQRYKSPSPGIILSQRLSGHLESSQFSDDSVGSNFRRRIQSPQRRDFKDFSRPPVREFRSPLKQMSPCKQPSGSGNFVSMGHHHRGYFDEDDDSGADSLNDQPSCASSCHQPPSSHQSSMSNLAMMQYRDPQRQIASPHQPSCCSPMVRSPPCCCHMHHHLTTSSSSLPCAVANYNPNAGNKVALPLETRLLQLEGDKDSLRLQVAMLSDQIDSQSDKISDLEKILDDKKDVLRKTEDILQREMLSRSSLETQKLELMSEVSNLKLRQAAVEKENLELRKRLARNLDFPVSAIFQPQSISTLSHSLETEPGFMMTGRNADFMLRYGQHAGSDVTTSLQTFGTLPRRSKKKQSSGNEHRNSSGPPMQLPPMTMKTLETSAPLETHFYYNKQSNNLDDPSAYKNATRTWPHKISNAHGGSAPSLVSDLASDRGESQPKTWNKNDDIVKTRDDNSSGPSSSHVANRAKELKKRLLGKMRRSNSGNLQEEKKKREKQLRASEDPSIFTRGGFNRSSAGSRLSDHISNSDPSLPFKHWKVETVCSWLEHLGMFMYIPEVKKHVQCGEQLLMMSSIDLDNKLGMKNALHKKKLRLALKAKVETSITQNLIQMAGRIDYQWVVRWLDDIGLPQYKDKFLEARLDGRMLHLLTVGDLFEMRISNMLHHLSIKSGIQVLRQNQFDPNCLKRRSMTSVPSDFQDSDNNQPFPEDVALWTNHRVMEWLRSADLAEYAPNLRGSGVHGALIVFEPRFTGDLLAALLSIPSSKTLLRRHLNIRFSDLVGKDVMQSKREAERDPHIQALTPTAKVKPQRQPNPPTQTSKTQFTLTRKKKCASQQSTGNEDFEDDLLCPFGSEDLVRNNSRDDSAKNSSDQEQGGNDRL